MCEGGIHRLHKLQTQSREEGEKEEAAVGPRTIPKSWQNPAGNTHYRVASPEVPLLSTLPYLTNLCEYYSQVLKSGTTTTPRSIRPYPSEAGEVATRLEMHFLLHSSSS